MSKSAIEWTEHTWNPFAGCAVLTPGCTNCYAMKMAARLDAMGQPLYKGLTKPSKAGPVWRGTIRRASDDVLLAPLARKKPTTYFVNSMSDLFYETFPDEWIDRVFAVMALCPQHTFQVLTKRAARMRDYVSARPQPIWDRQALIIHPSALEQLKQLPWPLPNVWLGVSTERQQEADERIPQLMMTPAAVRFISYEPALGPLDVAHWLSSSGTGPGGRRFWNTTKLDWVICGGESGPDARPMHPDWARSLRDQCAAANVPFFFKQWGGWAPHRVVPGADLGGDVRAGRVRIVHPSGRSDVEVFEATAGHNTERGSRYMAAIGKKAAGRKLDGAEHNAMPGRPA